jgi:hypothetical protein
VQQSHIDPTGEGGLGTERPADLGRIGRNALFTDTPDFQRAPK